MSELHSAAREIPKSGSNVIIFCQNPHIPGEIVNI